MLDIDGTTVPYDYEALPSDRVTEAIRKAQEKVAVCLATGRSYGFILSILKKLNMHSGYVIVDMGARVVDIATEELLYDRPIEDEDVHAVIDVFEKEGITYYLKQKLHTTRFTNKPHKKGQAFKKVYMFYTEEDCSLEKAEEIEKELSKYPSLTVHKTRHKNPNKYGFNITHVNATKLRGIEILMEKLNLKREEIIGVGDNYNDFPLLMASGFKVAMGNAVEDLKAIADYIAPSVDEDGVADVIEKFILS